MVYLA